mmetsp:Transcript_60245/g.160301  ORF Transcript_60245/g.160301 Transcript_60245/m.160301 type:complete len:251 (+) Transcript_60245:728-1480(+)
MPQQFVRSQRTRHMRPSPKWSSSSCPGPSSPGKRQHPRLRLPATKASTSSDTSIPGRPFKGVTCLLISCAPSSSSGAESRRWLRPSLKARFPDDMRTLICGQQSAADVGKQALPLSPLDLHLFLHRSTLPHRPPRVSPQTSSGSPSVRPDSSFHSPSAPRVRLLTLRVAVRANAMMLKEFSFRIATADVVTPTSAAAGSSPLTVTASLATSVAACANTVEGALSPPADNHRGPCGSGEAAVAAEEGRAGL